MFDSTGKLPDGIYSDNYDFCELLEQYQGVIPFNCDSYSLGFLKGRIALPMGNTKAYGSFESCLAVKTSLQYGADNNPFNIANFSGNYMRLKIKSLTQSTKPDTRMAPIIAGGGILEPIIQNFINISFNGDAEDIVILVMNYFQTHFNSHFNF